MYTYSIKFRRHFRKCFQMSLFFTLFTPTLTLTNLWAIFICIPRNQFIIILSLEAQNINRVSTLLAPLTLSVSLSLSLCFLIKITFFSRYFLIHMYLGFWKVIIKLTKIHNNKITTLRNQLINKILIIYFYILIIQGLKVLSLNLSGHMDQVFLVYFGLLLRWHSFNF